ncbi:MAG: alpha-L-glutamate ligase-like protein [Pseudohaliea sp.]
MRRWVSPRRLERYGMLGMNARNLDFVQRYNERSHFPLVDDKLRTKLLAEEHGVPTPSLRLVLRAQHQVGRVGSRLEALEGFAMKPAKGSGGKGIWVIRRQDEDGWVKASGARVGLADLQRHLSNTLAGLYSLGGNPDAVLLEDLISADDCFSGYSFEGVPDIRVVVFRGFPVMAMLRLSTHDSDGKANLHQGAVGVGLALDSGRCLRAVQFGQPLTLHPDTGRPLDAIRVPGWRELLLLAARCHDMTGLGYLGADLVLDRQRGPLLLELNARPGLAIQIANGCGLLPRLRRVEALGDRRLPEPAERVAWAMEAFAGR